MRKYMKYLILSLAFSIMTFYIIGMSGWNVFSYAGGVVSGFYLGASMENIQKESK